MARRRMIDPHFWESGDVAKLSIFTRFVLIGMFSKADDDGRGVGGAVYLRNTIFPYDDVPLKDIENALIEISERIAVTLYTVDGNEYYQFTNWKKWQRVDKPKPSILPPPSEEQPPKSPAEQEKPEVQNDSNTESEINSEINSEIDSGLKQHNRRQVEEEIEKNTTRARTREVGDDVHIDFDVAEEFERSIRPATRSDMDILDRICLNFSKSDILSVIKQSAGKAHSASYIETVLKLPRSNAPPGKFSPPDYSSPEKYANSKW